MTPTEELIKHMTNRFLQWKLPDNFRPDGGITFEPVGNAGTPHAFKRSPVGTNLLDYTQAEAMVRHMLDGAPLVSAPSVGEMKPTWFCDADDEESGAPDLEALVDATGSNSGETAFQMRVERFARLSDVYVVAYVNTTKEDGHEAG